MARFDDLIRFAASLGSQARNGIPPPPEWVRGELDVLDAAARLGETGLPQAAVEQIDLSPRPSDRDADRETDFPVDGHGPLGHTPAAPPGWVVMDAEPTAMEPVTSSAIQAEVAGAGLDALAYYAPFHMYEAWGIYIRAKGIWHLGRLIKGAELTRGDSRIADLATLVLLNHEAFHAQSELATTLAETVLVAGRYTSEAFKPAASELEEALANALSLRLTTRFLLPVEHARLVASMQSMPGGYANFANYGKRDTFAAGRTLLMQRIIDSGRSVSKLKDWPVGHLFHQHPVGPVKQRVPCYLVMDAPVPWLRFLRPFRAEGGVQVFVYPNDHLPAHVHVFMPPRKERTRYLWPERTAYPLRAPRERPLNSSEEKKLMNYVEKLKKDIDERVERCRPGWEATSGYVPE